MQPDNRQRHSSASNADPDIPIPEQAKAEYAKLRLSTDAITPLRSLSGFECNRDI
jgi:hypothetical protein